MPEPSKRPIEEEISMNADDVMSFKAILERLKKELADSIDPKNARTKYYPQRSSKEITKDIEEYTVRLNRAIKDMGRNIANSTSLRPSGVNFDTVDESNKPEKREQKDESRIPLRIKRSFEPPLTTPETPTPTTPKELSNKSEQVDVFHPGESIADKVGQPVPEVVRLTEENRGKRFPKGTKFEEKTGKPIYPPGYDSDGNRIDNKIVEPIIEEIKQNIKKLEELKQQSSNDDVKTHKLLGDINRTLADDGLIDSGNTPIEAKAFLEEEQLKILDADNLQDQIANDRIEKLCDSVEDALDKLEKELKFKNSLFGPPVPDRNDRLLFNPPTTESEEDWAESVRRSVGTVSHPDMAEKEVQENRFFTQEIPGLPPELGKWYHYKDESGNEKVFPENRPDTPEEAKRLYDAFMEHQANVPAQEPEQTYSRIGPSDKIKRQIMLEKLMDPFGFKSMGEYLNSPQVYTNEQGENFIEFTIPKRQIGDGVQLDMPHGYSPEGGDGIDIRIQEEINERKRKILDSLINFNKMFNPFNVSASDREAQSINTGLTTMRESYYSDTTATKAASAITNTTGAPAQVVNNNFNVLGNGGTVGQGQNAAYSLGMVSMKNQEPIYALYTAFRDGYLSRML